MKKTLNKPLLYYLIKKSYRLIKIDYDKYLTSRIIRSSKLFCYTYLISRKNLTWLELVIAVDKKEDFDLTKKLIFALFKTNTFFICLDIIDLLEKNIEWIKNSHLYKINLMRL